MDLNEIKELIKMIDESNLTVFELEKEDFKIVLKKETEKVLCRDNAIPYPGVYAEQNFLRGTHNASPGDWEQGAPTEKTAPSVSLAETINSPIVGTYYAASSPGGEPFVQAGTKVSKGTTLCIIEAMKLMNEIEAEEDLLIVNVLVQDGQMVEFGQPLFEIKRG
ncbi:acetyl-CoA carboxylase biotin carboxyl carrier protein [Dehalobacter sp. DCM]|uniref:acetyl-CoA carboxylase biotin carboxyl carrier protein n=1 Tax=Dehalobacter sp. DCM TaxID=2907827 RepID=UPI0030812183|nr:acetyl-CoA carboxylase biotin carboxyl carrier protein [Dehalobacter sp. DCM]